MRKSDIEVGKAYRIKMRGNKGRAIVTDKAVKSPGRWSWEKPVYKFPVEFPDSLDSDGNPETMMVQSRDFVYEWNDNHEILFQKQMKDEAKVDAIKEQLRSSGFNPEFVRNVGDGQIYLAFRGDTADHVFEKLTYKENI